MKDKKSFLKIHTDEPKIQNPNKIQGPFKIK